MKSFIPPPVQGRDWEPRYGYTVTDPVRLASALEHVRRRICTYGRTGPCDCKYGVGEYLTGATNVSTATGEPHISSEATGCPELRAAIYLLLHGDPT